MPQTNHWHRPDREKRCILCGETKPLSAFRSYAYTTNQGNRSTRYESRCGFCCAQRDKRRRAANQSKYAEQHRLWCAANREHRSAYNSARQKDPAHRANKAKSQRLRKARMRSGQGDNTEIRAIYAQAIREEALIQHCPLFDLPELGKKLHVDHRIPLSKGGLHAAQNLQILPIGINMRKGAKCPL